MPQRCGVPECDEIADPRPVEIHVMGLHGVDARYPRYPACSTHAQLINWWNRLLPTQALAVVAGDFSTLNTSPLRMILLREPFATVYDDYGARRIVPDAPELDGLLILLRQLHP